jgi:plasmid stabilization system protein ParE
MKEIRNIKVSLQAVFDIADAEDWIEQQFGIDECDRYERELKDFLSDKLRFSAGIIGRTGVLYLGHMIYKMPYRVTNIFYFIENETLYIIRILRYEKAWERYIGHGENYLFED